MSVKIDLSGTSAVVFGVANHRSIAWAIAESLYAAGADLTITYQNERMGKTALDLIKGLDRAQGIECDVLDQKMVNTVIEKAAKRAPLKTVVHAVAFANRDDLVPGVFASTELEGFRLALEVSAYSLLPIARSASNSMDNGGSIITLSFHAAEKVYPGYNIMGVAKAALENEVRQLASELGTQNIRVNAISAGPLNTLAGRGIGGFTEMQEIHASKAPLKRNITHEEVGNTALFLSSHLSSGITGEVIYVDAGYNVMGV